jgi:hypothetical protein
MLPKDFPLRIGRNAGQPLDPNFARVIAPAVPVNTP